MPRIVMEKFVKDMGKEINLDYVFKNPHLFTVGDLKKMIGDKE